MREEHRRGMRSEGWGPPPRPGDPEWAPWPGRGPGRYGGERGGPEFRGGPGGPGHPGRPGGPGGRRFGRPGPGEDFPPFPPFGPGGPGGPGGFGDLRAAFADERGFGRHGFGRGQRARKGDVRAAILDLFAEEEGRTWNGYQLIQEIPARTDGAWRPSAGSVYPVLQQLEDEGLIAPQGTGRRRLFAITEAGSAYAREHADQLRASWDAAAGMTDDDAVEFRNLIRQVMMAVMEVRRAGSAEQVSQARAVLAQARKSLYLILAEDDAGAQPAPAPAPAPAAGAAEDGPQGTGQDTVQDTVQDTTEDAE